MSPGTRNALWQEKELLVETISGTAFEIDEHNRLIKLLIIRPPSLRTQSQIDQELGAILRLSRQINGLVKRLAIVDVMLAMSNN